VRSFAVLAIAVLAGATLVAGGCSPRPDVDLILRGGTIYDGSGEPGRVGDVAIRGDSIVAVGDVGALTAARVLDVKGLAVAPGFIDVLSRADRDLLSDGGTRGQVRQGVTLEVLGVGESMGPLTDSMKAALRRGDDDAPVPVSWTTLGGYLDELARRGVAPNVASFVGATTVRVHELGSADRAPTPAELARMQDLVRAAMREGALGVGADLRRAPGAYAGTAELVALARAAAEDYGLYVGGPRNGEGPVGALDEALDVAHQSGAPVTVVDAAATDTVAPATMDSVLQRVDTARAQGLRVTVDVIPWARTDSGPRFREGSGVRAEIGRPWVGFGSDAAAPAAGPVRRAEGTRSAVRGTFARILGTYVREEGALTLRAAVRRLTSLPAETLGLRRRGRIAPGYLADVTVFDPATIGAPAPGGASGAVVAGARDVFVNGVEVVRDGAPTGAKPGIVLRGPGWTG
jgi:N-acyl-D-amino-acid deacylase